MAGNAGKQDDRNWKKLSLFDENSWLEAGHESKTVVAKEDYHNGHSVIKIIPNYTYYNKDRSDLAPIIGVLLRNVSFSLNSEWQSMGVPKIPSVIGMTVNAMNAFDVGVLGGSGEFGSVYKSKKLWRKSGDLKISPEFRIVDWHGDGEPLRSALQIARYCLPGNRDSDINKTAKKVEEAAKKYQNILSNRGDQTLEGAKNNSTNQIGRGGFSLSQEVLSILESISDSLIDDIHDVFTLKDAPPPLKVQIGQYFYHPDMILENVSFDFSRELSMYGPLYVDVKLDLSSRKILNGIKDVGIHETKNITSRVEIQSGQSSIMEFGEKTGTMTGNRELEFTNNGKILTLIDDKKRKGAS